MESTTFDCTRAGKTVTLTWKVSQARGGQGNVIAEKPHGLRCDQDTACGFDFNWDECEYVKRHGKL